ncbi:hypothetical protein F2P56_017683 [Juglans regia]|uniref:Protein EMBRYONIC FLOWER 1-like n=2 Tax=Juglans regia TaxID=51240 RepID=A0A2I4ELW1_JUGRE|nr:protein EMBRYONIC FLOWER 1-like [Juglans regia]XP_035548629.1 protein EMBRYONIC FLOWER 1-like [Juglans regia]KAF5461602.1 hypothetical protein F2P56_017683 [Juglans regia]
MEISGIEEEKNPCKNNSNFVSTSDGSFIQIDSISVDLVSEKDHKSDAEKCEHFSIRGYVSKVRKKYWKICCPFYLEVDRNESEEHTSFLPPLDAPKFRWWHCQNCLSEFAAKDCGTLFNCCSTQCGSASSGCLHVGSAAVTFLPGFQKTPKPVLSETSADSNTSSKLNNDNRLLFCNDKKENNVEVAQNTLIGRLDIDSEQNHNQERLPKFVSAATEINSSMIQERHANDTVTLKSKRNGSIEFDEPGSGSRGAADGNLKCRVKNPAEHYLTGMQTSPDDQHTELTKAPCQTLGYLGSMVGVEPNAVNPPTTGNHSDQELDHESDYKESESVEIMVLGNDLLDHRSDKSCYLHRRKSRKVRLLTELLGENGDEKSDPIETDNSPFNRSRSDAFGGLDTLFVTRGQVAIQGNVKRDSSQTSKRKLPQDEEWRPPEMASPNNLKKKAKAWKRDAETTDAIVGNEFQDAIAGIDLKTDMKSHRKKRMNDRSPTTGKKKNKKIQVADACFSLAPKPVNVQKEIQEKFEILSKSNASDRTVSFRFDHNPFKGRGIDPFHVPALRMERKRNMCQKRNKNPKAYGGQAALFPWTKEVLKNDTITRKSVDIIETGSATNPFQSAQDSSTGKGLCLSLDSYLDVQGHDKEFISQVEDGRPSFLPWQEVNPKVDQLRENIEITNFEHPRVPSKSPPAAFSGKCVTDEVSSKKTTSRMPLLNNIQNCLSQVEDRKCSRTHQRIFSGPSNIDNALKANEHPVVEEKHSDQKAGKVCEQGPLDDIPMEVVELMAKNQYERCLPDAENKKGFLETTPNTRNARMMGCTNIYGNGELRLLQKDNTHKQKFQARNGRNGLIIKGQKLGPSKQKSVDYSSQIDRNNLNVSHLHQTETPTVFRTFVQSQKAEPSSGVQFSATDSSRHSNGQNCNWNGGTMGHVPSHEILLALGGYDTRQTVRQSEAAVHLWPTMVPNQMPFACSMPQSGLSQSNNKGMLSKHSDSLQKGNINVNHDLKFFNLNATILEKHNMRRGSETSSRTNAEYPFAFKHNGIELPQSLMGPSDLYSNEAIPAMHLLSLMDAGMQSGPTFNVGGTPKLPGRPSFPHDRKSKEFQRKEIIGSYKTMDSMKQPSSHYHGKTHFSEKSHGCFHCISTVGASVSSFQRDKASQRATNFTGQVTLKFQEKDKTRSSSSPTQARDNRSEKYVFPTGSSGTNHGAIPVHRVQKRFLGASDSSVLTLQYHGALDNSTQHPKSSSVSELCSVNRNPADFSMPGVGSTYMIRGEELKFGKVTDPSQTRYGLIQLNGRKRHRNLKRAIVKEHVQHCL